MGSADRPRLRLAAALTGVLIAVGLLSAWHSGLHMWRYMDREYDAYSQQSELQRRHAPSDEIAVPGEVFDFYADRIARGDRIYLQIAPGRARPDAIEAAARYYLLPGVVVADLADANVIVSFFEDPATLGVPLLTQEQAGLQPIFVSRIAPHK